MLAVHFTWGSFQDEKDHVIFILEMKIKLFLFVVHLH